MLDAIATAVNEFNLAAGSSWMPRVSAIACPTDQASIESLLTTSQVQVIVGPIDASDIGNVDGWVGGRAVLFAPLADAPVLAKQSSSSRESTLVSCKPNRIDGEAELLAATQYMKAHILSSRSQTAVLAISDTEQELGFDGLFAGSIADTVFYDALPAGQGLVTALAIQSTGLALLVAASTTSDWRQNILAVDRGISSGPLPYYLLAEPQSDVLDLAVNDMRTKPAEYERVFGLEDRLQQRNLTVQHHFGVALQSRADDPETVNLGHLYDCTYFAIYSALAAELRFALSPRQISTQAIVASLSALTGGRAPSIAVNDVSDVARALDVTQGEDASVDVFGASGDLDLMNLTMLQGLESTGIRAYLRPKQGDKELYSVDKSDGGGLCNTGVVLTLAGDETEVDRNCSNPVGQ